MGLFVTSPFHPNLPSASDPLQTLALGDVTKRAMKHAANLLTVVAVVLFASVIGLWGYAFVYQPLVQGRWLFVISVVAGGLFWTGLKETARRKAESIDYTSR